MSDYYEALADADAAAAPQPVVHEGYRRTRKALAEAASRVRDDINVSPYYQQTTEPGDGFVRLDRVEYPDFTGGVCYWNVVVLLSQDLAEAEAFIEGAIWQVRAALQTQMTVTQVRAERLIFPGAGELPCVFINGYLPEED